jgi:hypothetical protein
LPGDGPQGVVQAGDAQQPDHHRGGLRQLEDAPGLLRVFRHAQQRAQAPGVAESNSGQVGDHGPLVTVDNRPDTLQGHIGGNDIQLAFHIHDGGIHGGFVGGQCSMAQHEKQRARNWLSIHKRSPYPGQPQSRLTRGQSHDYSR